MLGVHQALQLTVKSAAPIVAMLFTASELGRYIYKKNGGIAYEIS